MATATQHNQPGGYPPMALKVMTGESGFLIEVDGRQSEPHLYGFTAEVVSPSGKHYFCTADATDDGRLSGGKPQMYVGVPVESLHIDAKITPDDIEDGYMEEQIEDSPGPHGGAAQLDDPEDEEEEEEEEDEGDGTDGGDTDDDDNGGEGPYPDEDEDDEEDEEYEEEEPERPTITVPGL